MRNFLSGLMRRVEFTQFPWTDFNKNQLWNVNYLQRHSIRRKSTKNSCHVVGRLAVVQQVIEIVRVRLPSRWPSTAARPLLSLMEMKNKFFLKKSFIIRLASCLVFHVWLCSVLIRTIILVQNSCNGKVQIHTFSKIIFSNDFSRLFKIS